MTTLQTKTGTSKSEKRSRNRSLFPYQNKSHGKEKSSVFLYPCWRGCIGLSAKDGDNLEDAKKQNGKRMLPYLQQKYLPPTRKHCFVYMSATSLKWSHANKISQSVETFLVLEIKQADYHVDCEWSLSLARDNQARKILAHARTRRTRGHEAIAEN